MALLLMAMLTPPQSYCQEEKKIPDGTEGLYFKKHVYDSTTGLAKNLDDNEFDGKFSSFKIGMGLIYDFATYIQDDEFKQQMDSAGFDLGPTFKLRDFRVLGSGQLKTRRTLSFKFAFFYDGNLDTWLVRESGITIGVPELAGHIFIGRTKEGFSLVKVMNGHSPWGMERQMVLDPIPILADGIKWFGYLPKSRIFWNLGAFVDWISKGQGFSTFEWQYVARVGWLPLYDKQNHKVVHLAGNFRYGKPVDGKITLKSRPESNPTPLILNTGQFDAEHSWHIGGEAYYSNKRFLIGSEILTHNFYSDQSGDHKFYGGDVFIAYMISGNTRPYNTVGSIYGFVPQAKKSIFKGGAGQWEAVLKFSKYDLDDGVIKGGKFWRITPMVNWYLNKIIRWEFVYGYGIFERYNLKGKVQFFETRLQFSVL